MMYTVLALSAISSTFAATKVITRTHWSQCTVDGAQFGSSAPMSAVKDGCSNMGLGSCTDKVFWANTTDGLLGCQNKLGDRLNITGTCQTGNTTLACADIDGTKAAEITMWDGSNCNGTAMPLGIFTAGTCTYLTSSSYVKLWQNDTGLFAATYSAAGCVAATQTHIVALAATTATSGCAKGALADGEATVKWALLETPVATSAPTASSNSTNTTAPASSSTMAIASLASVVVAAASLMM